MDKNLSEARKAIRTLQKEVEYLRTALAPFACLSRSELSAGDVNRARRTMRRKARSEIMSKGQPNMRDLIADPKFNAANAIPFAFQEGNVVKRRCDYVFAGVVLAVFRDRSGSPRYAVENEDGIIHIFDGHQLELA